MTAGMSRDPQMSTAIRQLAGQIAEADRRIRDLERSAQLGYSSVEGGAVDVYDTDGVLRQTVGQQSDGTFTSRDWNGPPPPVPTLPSVAPIAGQLVIGWDGTFQFGAPAPLDWSHVEVHVSTVSGYSPTADTQVATFATLKGGSVSLALPPMQHYVRLVSVSTSGVESTPTAEVPGVPVVAPTTSPAPTVQGTVGALLVNWPATLGSPIGVEVHISTDPAFVPSQGNAATLVRTVNGTGTVIRAMPDGSPLEYTYQQVTDPNTVPPTTAEVPRVYYVRTIALNETGTAPPSAVGSGSMVQITGPDVAAGTVFAASVIADQIESGNLNADIGVIGSLTAPGAAGEQVSLNGSGFYVRGPDAAGNPTYIEFPTDGAKPNIVGGELNASVLTVAGGATLRGPSTIESESTLDLASRVQAPRTAPMVVDSWESIQLGMTAPDGTRFTAVCGGFCRGPTGTMWACVGTGNWHDGATHVAEWDWDSGQMLQAFRPPISSWGTAARGRGIMYGTVSGVGLWFILQQNGDKPCYVDVLSSSWVFLNGNQVLTANQRGQREAIGWDHVNNTGPIVGYMKGGGTHRLRFTSTTNGVLTQAGSVDLGDDPEGGASLGFIGFGPFDYGAGATRNVYSTTFSSQGDQWRVCGNSNGSKSVKAEEWTAAESRDVYGGCWDAQTGLFYSISDNNRRYTYLGGEAMWTSGPSTWWVGSTYYDSKADLNATPPNYTHETDLSEVRPWTKKKRAGYTVTINPIPTGTGGMDSPDRAGVWVAKSDTNPPLVDYVLRVEITAPATTWTWTGGGPNTWTDTGLPVTGADTDLSVNDFPDLGVAALRASAAPRADGYPPLEVRGDGTGRWDYLLPPGTVMMWAGVIAPPGWLACDGQAVAIADYTDLYNALGSASSPFGVNLTAGTFNLPDLRGRFPIGANATYPRGQVGGAASVAVNARHVPPHVHHMQHNHGMTHSHGILARKNNPVGANPDHVAAGGGNDQEDPNNTAVKSYSGNTADNAQAKTGDGSNDGLANDPLSVLNPYTSLAYIIRY